MSLNGLEALPKELDASLHKTLLKCDEFESHNSLSAVFVTEELVNFKDGLPQVGNKRDRVSQTIAYLLRKRLNDNRPVLPIFLAALRNKHQHGDALRNELDSHLSELGKPLISGPVSTDSLPYTRIHGRIKEIKDIQDFLSDKSGAGDKSFITICGMSGVGKTVLAAHTVNHLADAYQTVVQKGVAAWDEFLDQVASKLSISGDLSQIIAFIRNESLLLVLDGVDDLLEDDKGLIALLAALWPNDNGKVIITSRRPTGLPGELVIRLEPFSSEEAKCFFTTRSEYHQEDLSLEQQADIAAICGPDLLDGLPMAINIVCGHINSRRDRDLALIRSRLASEVKQRKGKGLSDLIGTAIELSFDDLSPMARKLLIRLSVFPNEFSEEDLKAVAGVIPKIDLFVAEEELVARNLLRKYSKTFATYDLHTLVRAFAQNQLSTLPKSELRAVHTVVGHRLIQSGASTRWLAGLTCLFDSANWKEVLTEVQNKYGNEGENPQVFPNLDFPSQVLEARACCVIATIFNEQGDWETTRKYIAYGKRLLNHIGPTNQRMSLSLRFLVLEARSLLASGAKAQQGMEVVDEAIELVNTLLGRLEQTLQWEIGQVRLLQGIKNLRFDGNVEG